MVAILLSNKPASAKKNAPLQLLAISALVSAKRIKCGNNSLFRFNTLSIESPIVGISNKSHSCISLISQCACRIKRLLHLISTPPTLAICTLNFGCTSKSEKRCQLTPVNENRSKAPVSTLLSTPSNPKMITSKGFICDIGLLSLGLFKSQYYRNWENLSYSTLIMS